VARSALRVRDPGLLWLKTDPLMDPLRKEPRCQGGDAGVDVSAVSRQPAKTFCRAYGATNRFPSDASIDGPRLRVCCPEGRVALKDDPTETKSISCFRSTLALVGISVLGVSAVSARRRSKR